ncbi:MAG: hypothetical protein ACRC5M_02725 [Anaeroplasmataceae bacterium]
MALNNVDLYNKDKGHTVKVVYNNNPDSFFKFKDRYFKTLSGAEKFEIKCKEKGWFTKIVSL